MASLHKHDGYLMIDHRASPGIPSDIAQAMNLDPRHCGEGKLWEAATLSCSHCRCAVVVNPLRTRERAYCQRCDHYICDACGVVAALPDYQHFPYDKFADVVLDNAEKGVVLGSPHELLFATK